MERQLLLIGDENTKVGVTKVDLEKMLNLAPIFEQCLTLTTLLDKLRKVQSPVRHVMIDCLSNIVHGLMLAASVEMALTEGMTNIGTAIASMVAQNPGLRVYIAQPVPRKSQESKNACVYIMKILASTLKLVPTAWVLTWSTTLDVKPTGLMTEGSCKQFLEEFARFVQPRMSRDRLESIASYDTEIRPTQRPPLIATPSIDLASQLILNEDEEMRDDDVFGENDKTIQSATGTDHLATKVSVRALEAKVLRQTRVVEKFYSEYKTRRILDMIAFADQAERSDFASNKLREDCVVITGLRGKEFPKEMPEQNKVAMGIVKNLVRKVLSREEEFTVSVKMVFERKFARGTGELILPPFEVKMSTAAAFEFRTKAANMAKSKAEGFHGVYFGISTTLGTRIRCEILQILCKRLNEKYPNLDHYCINNNMRPLMSCGTKGAKGGRKTLLYIEAVRKYIEVFQELDLTGPYARARDFFAGRLEHTFAVLYEEEDRPQQPPASGLSAMTGVKHYLSSAPNAATKKFFRE